MLDRRYNAPLHHLALLTAVLTFPLIFMGGLVTSHGAGMSVPDWPNSWGYNMFTFPPSKWVGGIFYEHTHRLMATVIGMLSIAIVIVAFKTDRRRWVRWLAIGVLIGVIAQGVLGGMRVVFSDRAFAMVHGYVAQLFFCFIATFCVLTSRFWSGRETLAPADADSMRGIFRAACAAVIAVLAQLALGVVMRQSDAGLAIPDFPLSYGHLFPPLVVDHAFHERAVHDFGTNLGLAHVTAFQIWIHFAHRVGAVCVTAAILWLCAGILRKAGGIRELRVPAIVLLILLPAQITLGILTVLMRKPADIASLHVAIGSLVLVTSWVTLVRAYGLLRPMEREMEQPAQASAPAELDEVLAPA